MWGYIIAPVTGDYKFYSTTEGEGEGAFFLSTNSTRDGLPVDTIPPVPDRLPHSSILKPARPITLRLSIRKSSTIIS